MDYLLYSDLFHRGSYYTCDVTTTRPRVQLWPRLSRWIHRSVTFCETWWPRGLSAWSHADKCQSAGTWGRSPFSSGCRLSSVQLQNSSLWAVLCSSGWPSWCCSQCWPEWTESGTHWKTMNNDKSSTYINLNLKGGIYVTMGWVVMGWMKVLVDLFLTEKMSSSGEKEGETPRSTVSEQYETEPLPKSTNTYFNPLHTESFSTRT